MDGRLSWIAGSGREAHRTADSGRETVPGCGNGHKTLSEGLGRMGGYPGGPGVVGRPTRIVWRPSRIARSGREAHPDGPEWLKKLPDGREWSRGPRG